MPLPALYTPAVPALYVGEEVVLWYGYARTREGVKDVLLDYEVHGGDVAGALGRLARRVRPRHPYVLAHVDPQAVLTRFVPMPQLEDDERGAWERAQIQNALPAGYAPQDLAVGTAVVHAAGGGKPGYEDDGGGAPLAPRLLVSVTTREAVEGTLSLLEAAGLRAAALYALAPLVGYAFLSETALVEETCVVRWERGFDVRYRGGAPEDVRAAPHPTEPARYTVEEPRAEQLNSMARLGNHLGGSGAGHGALSLFAAPCAMAITRRFDGLARVDLLDDEPRVAATVALDRLGALRVSAWAAAFLLVVFGALGAYAAWAASALGAAQQGVEARVPDLRALEREEEALAAVAAARGAELQFAATRSRAAAWLAAAALEAPATLRLSSFRAATDSLGAVVGTVRGVARTEAAVGDYVARLRDRGTGAVLRYVLRAEESPFVTFEIVLSGRVEAGP